MRKLVAAVGLCFGLTICSTLFGAPEQSSSPTCRLFDGRIERVKGDVFLDYEIVFWGRTSSLLYVPRSGPAYEVSYRRERGAPAGSGDSKGPTGKGASPGADAGPFSYAESSPVILARGSYVGVLHSRLPNDEYTDENSYSGRLRLCGSDDFKKMTAAPGWLVIRMRVETMEFPVRHGIESLGGLDKLFTERKLELRLDAAELRKAAEK